MGLDKNKVAVGLSGGVDSAATAYLLKKQGYDVIGITMYLFDYTDADGKPYQPPFIEDAKRVADRLGIPHYVEDMRALFDEKVRSYFEKSYLEGVTPNPCVMCNKHVKYGELINRAHKHGAYYLATGHYANVEFDESSNIYRIYRGVSDRKDQAYVLNGLKQEQLKYLMLPLGSYEDKSEVRKIALNVLTEIAEKKDSVGICFIEGDHKEYLRNKYPDDVKEGDFVDGEGTVLGKHKGLIYYTIGQKRNLGVHFDPPKFVVEINEEKNQIVLGSDAETYATGFIAHDCNFTLFETLKEPISVRVKVCQWGLFLEASLVPMRDGHIMVVFNKKERAIAPGQTAVFYLGEDEVIGGATIERILK